MMLTYIKQGAESNGAAGDKYNGLDTFGRVIDQRWIQTSDTSNSFDRYQYTYDSDGNVLSKTNGFDSTLNENYSYDALNRLTQVTRNGTSNNYQSFSLDGLGNISGLTNGTSSALDSTFTDQNQLSTMETSSGHTITLAFDNDGNTTTDYHGYMLKYDAWNRLVSVSNGTSSIMTYAFDGTGRKITETPGGSHPTELYYSAQDQVIEEDINNSGLSLQTQEVWSPVYVNALVLRDYDYNNNGSFVASERVYVIQDANYNVTALLTRYTLLGDGGSENGTVDIQDLTIVTNHWHMSVSGGDVNGDFNHDGYVDQTDQDIVTNQTVSSSGNVTWHVTERLTYDPYGKFTVKTYDDTGTQSGTSDFLAWNYTFQGGRYNATTELVDFQAREFSTTEQRFIQQDPAKYIDGLNDYLFVGDNPTSWLDPSGGYGEPISPSPISQGPPSQPGQPPSSPQSPRQGNNSQNDCDAARAAYLKSVAENFAWYKNERNRLLFQLDALKTSREILLKIYFANLGALESTRNRAIDSALAFLNSNFHEVNKNLADQSWFVFSGGVITWMYRGATLPVSAAILAVTEGALVANANDTLQSLLDGATRQIKEAFDDYWLAETKLTFAFRDDDLRLEGQMVHTLYALKALDFDLAMKNADALMIYEKQCLFSRQNGV